MNLTKTLPGIICAMMASTSLHAAEPSNQELLNLIKQQQAEIDHLKQKANQTDMKLDATATQLEDKYNAHGDVIGRNTQIGGYGELHYQNLDGNKNLDLHRFVLFFGHQFNSNTRLFSELEVEHSFVEGGKGGEVAMEQAYIEHDLTKRAKMQLGLFLMPVGIINETHEPPAFYGVERNPVEKNIIPATWREGGALVHFRLQPGLALDLALTSGLNVATTGATAFNLRDGRQNASKAIANKLAYTGRLKYTAINGLELAATINYQTDITQGLGSQQAPATLYESHAIYQIKSFTLKALYASWHINNDTARSLGKDRQRGFYVEPSYKLNDQLGFFARINQYNNSAGLGSTTRQRQTNIGLNYWLAEGVVLKADLEKQNGLSNQKGFNLGVGYQF
jgi:hypothetical protein